MEHLLFDYKSTLYSLLNTFYNLYFIRWHKGKLALSVSLALVEAYTQLEASFHIFLLDSAQIWNSKVRMVT
jgi:hypothetical protein